jgi:hypothetical protein
MKAAGVSPPGSRVGRSVTNEEKVRLMVGGLAGFAQGITPFSPSMAAREDALASLRAGFAH